MVRDEVLACSGCGNLPPARARCCPDCGAVRLVLPSVGSVLQGRWQVTARLHDDVWGSAVHEAEDVRVHGRRVLIRQWARPFEGVSADRRWRLLEARAGTDVPSLPAWYDLYAEAESWWAVEARVPWHALEVGWAMPAGALLRVASGLIEALEALHAAGLDADAPVIEDLRLDPDGEAILLARGGWQRWSWHPLGKGPEEEDAGQRARADLAAVAAILRGALDGPCDDALESLLLEMERAPLPGGAAGAGFLQGRAVLLSVPRPAAEESAPVPVQPSGGEPSAAWRLARGLETLWRQPLSVPVDAVVPLGDTHLGTWDREGVLTLRRWGDGAEVWSRPAPAPGLAPAGGVFFGGRWCMAAQDTLVAVGLQTAEPEWMIDVRGLRARDQLAVAGGLLVVADPVERMHLAWDVTGRPVWQASFGKARAHLDVEALDRLDGRVRWAVADNLLAWAFKGRMGVRDVLTGTALWEEDLPSGPEGASRQALVCIGEGVMAIVDRGGKAWLHDARTGTALWHQHAQPGGIDLEAPCVLDGQLVLSASPWKWAALDLRTGERQWALHVGGTSLTLRPAPPSLLAQGASGPLLRVEPRSGRILEQADPGCAMTGGPWIMPDGGILSVLEDSLLAAFR
ncbi:MAG: PQQ-binding-like beta-propeller repeat protein [Candidatus Sericytochromatia bacterium]|nr:PQQ-binding-like beta-propeller repeat protein [Candidatus Sericytochromatia bacterium]